MPNNHRVRHWVCSICKRPSLNKGRRCTDCNRQYMRDYRAVKRANEEALLRELQRMDLK